MEGKISAKNGLEFILAGKATVTLVSKATGTRFTYKVSRPSADKPHFVRLLTGPNNRTDYKYMGRIQSGQYIHDRKNRAGSEDSPSAKGFRWVLYKLQQRQYDLVDASVEIWHSGKCGRCGRKLTVPESIATGIGPVCAGKATPASRSHNVIRKPKRLQAKASDCVVTEGPINGTYNVKSPSGETYVVEVKDGNAYCTCEWGSYRPGQDKRCGCSHGQAALDYVERKTANRTLSAWTSETDAQRQHRPARHIGDGVIVTSRKQDTSAAWAANAAASRRANAKASWAESQPTAEMIADAEAKAEFARMEIELDQAAEMAKMEYENSMVERLMARAG